ncbi:MAG: NTP transferase domain-containing protein, partial [Deltaproteobacteria bacterium]|nr:NTP transferase domain-containing protein [Deltaproteobacteria bacterium]
MNNLAAVILAAGKGTRMKSQRAKVLHEIAGLPLLAYPVQAAKTLGCDKVCVVVGHQGEAIQQAFRGQDIDFAWQREQLGTGHALLCAAESLAGFRGDLLLLCGDVPLLSSTSLESLLAVHRREKAAVTVLTARLEDPGSYGRIIRQGEL